RRRHTRLQGDWSSDVCSSDLMIRTYGIPLKTRSSVTHESHRSPQKSHSSGFSRNSFPPRCDGSLVNSFRPSLVTNLTFFVSKYRSEERRVGKECRYQWSRCQQ